MSSFASQNSPSKKTQVKQDITQIIENLLETAPDEQFVDLNPFGNKTILVNKLKDYCKTKKSKPGLLSLRRLAATIIEEERQKYDCFLHGQKYNKKNKETVATKNSKYTGLSNDDVLDDRTICEGNPPLKNCLEKGEKTKTASPKPKPPKECGSKIGSIQPGKILRGLKNKKKSPSPSSLSPTTVMTPPGILFSSPSSSRSRSSKSKTPKSKTSKSKTSKSKTPKSKTSKSKTGGVRLPAKTRKKKYRSKTRKNRR